MRLNVVEPYHSRAMRQLAEPVLANLRAREGLVVMEGEKPDPTADLNWHVPWHTLVEPLPTDSKSRHIMVYTHVNAGQEPMLMAACRQADAIVALTYKGREQLLRLGVPPTKISVASPSIQSFQPRCRIIGIVGDEQPNGRKRSHILLDLAWRMDLTPFQFLIVGKGWEPVVTMLRNMGIQVEHRLNLSHEELQAAYHRMDYLLVTAYREGGPLPLLEALACGVPVIAPTAVGYMSDLHHALGGNVPGSGMEYHGWLIPYDDISSLIGVLEDSVRPVRAFSQLVGTYSLGLWVEENLRLFEWVSDRDLPPLPGEARRYRQLSTLIDGVKPHIILEIGTCRGERALQMIDACLRYYPADHIMYWGFDLFEDATPKLLAKEFTVEKPPLPKAVVEARLRTTGARIHLVKGNTRDTLAQNRVSADLMFIDCGHSFETIAADWKALEPCIWKDTVVVLDDSYIGSSPDLPSGVGCQKLLASLDPEKWRVEPLPGTDTFTKDWGTLAVQMVMVRRLVPTREEAESTAEHIGFSLIRDGTGVYSPDLLLSTSSVPPEAAPRGL